MLMTWSVMVSTEVISSALLCATCAGLVGTVGGSGLSVSIGGGGSKLIWGRMLCFGDCFFTTAYMLDDLSAFFFSLFGDLEKMQNFSQIFSDDIEYTCALGFTSLYSFSFYWDLWVAQAMMSRQNGNSGDHSVVGNSLDWLITLFLAKHTDKPFSLICNINEPACSTLDWVL